MKRIFTILGILFAILCFSFWGLHQIREVQTQLTAVCDELPSLAKEQRADAVKDLVTAWEKDKVVLGCLLHHNTLDKITDSMEALQAAQQAEDDSVFLIKLAEIKLLLARLYEDEIPSVDNVF